MYLFLFFLFGFGRRVFFDFFDDGGATVRTQVVQRGLRNHRLDRFPIIVGKCGAHLRGADDSARFLDTGNDLEIHIVHRQYFTKRRIIRAGRIVGRFFADETNGDAERRRDLFREHGRVEFRLRVERLRAFDEVRRECGVRNNIIAA